MRPKTSLPSSSAMSRYVCHKCRKQLQQVARSFVFLGVSALERFLRVIFTTRRCHQTCAPVLLKITKPTSAAVARIIKVVTDWPRLPLA